MITNIQLDGSANDVLLNFTFQTEQIFTYRFEIADGDGVVKQSGSGEWDGPTSFNLGAGTALTNLYLNIFWNIADPLGAGNAFMATAACNQSAQDLQVLQITSGTTTATTVNQITEAQFT